MDEAASTDGEQAPADDDAVIETPEERLTRLEAERAQLQSLLEHEAEANRRILEAHGIAEGRLAELEGVLTGTETVRARAEAERERAQDAARIAELEQRLAEELAQAASHAESLNAELKQAREDVRPRAARKLAEVQAASTGRFSRPPPMCAKR